MQARQESDARPGRCKQAAATVVTRADCRLAQACVCGQQELSGVTRDDLPWPLYIGPRRLKKGIVGAFAASSSHAPLTSCGEDGGTRQNLCAVSISERPAEAENRAIPGHWEGDLVFGSANSQIATLVKRQTRFVMLVKTGGKDTETVINALIKHAGKLPDELYKSLTWDRGREMADHKRFTVATDIKVYFSDPHNPWQRGSNENTNGLLRQYFPKGIDLSGYSQAKLNAVARRLNERPRKTLNFDTPAERFHQIVASTG
jgi:IS30 family transposase